MQVVSESAKKPVASDLDCVNRTPICLLNGPITYFGLGLIEFSECIPEPLFVQGSCQRW